MHLENGIPAALPVSVISGLRRSPRLLNYAGATGNVLVLFKEGGASAFFPGPLHELFEASRPLEDFVGRGALDELEEALAAAPGNARRAAIVERFLLSRRRAAAQADPLVLWAVDRIKSAAGDIRIKEMLTTLHISRDPFEKRFRRMVGTSPKQFSSIVRLRHIIDIHSRVKTLTEAAHSAGYFDQAHFIKDFKAFTGQTPRDFFAAPALW